MGVLCNYFDKIKMKDYHGLAELFDDDCWYDDSCISGIFGTETHLRGREAIEMHFANRFIFQTYLGLEGKEFDSQHGMMDVLIIGKPVKVLVNIEALNEGGLIKAIKIEPADKE